MRKLKADLDRLKATLEEKNLGGAEALRFAEAVSYTHLTLPTIRLV